jgi:hypothetical protein
MRLSPTRDPHDGAGAASVICSLVMSPAEWRDIYVLAKFAQAGLAYDCEAPYVIQVFTYYLSQPRELEADKDLQAAFLAIDGMAAETPSDRSDPRDVNLTLPKEQMRQLLVALDLAADGEQQADTLHMVAPDRFIYPFPKITVAAPHYAKAFEDLLTAVHKDLSLEISFQASGNAPPRLDLRTLPNEVRIYLGEQAKMLAAQNPEVSDSDTRTLEIQIADLVQHINLASQKRYQAETSSVRVQPAAAEISHNSFDYQELKASIERRGGTISEPLTAEQLKSTLSADTWSKITNIDPELIRQEEERQNIPLVPYLGRFNRERSLAKTLLDDERIKPYLQAKTGESEKSFKQSKTSQRSGIHRIFNFLKNRVK